MGGPEKGRDLVKNDRESGIESFYRKYTSVAISSEYVRFIPSLHIVALVGHHQFDRLQFVSKDKG